MNDDNQMDHDQNKDELDFREVNEDGTNRTDAPAGDPDQDKKNGE